MIIDVHTHTFPDKIAQKVVNALAREACTSPFSDGTMAGLLEGMRHGKVDYSVNLPVMTSPEQVEKINGQFIETREQLLQQGIICFGGMHPEYEQVRKELTRLKNAGMRGIKIHPAYQKLDLNHPKMMNIMAIASELDLIVITHAGIDIGIYDHDYASVKHVLQVLKEVQPTKLVLAHMGGWGCWEDVLRDLAGAPVYFDTAFSLGPIYPLPDWEKAPIADQNLSPEDFARIARKHGTDKILFATDSPWQEQAEAVALVNNAPLSSEEKEQIFYQNAAELLHIAI
ncbi:MAG: amidohydrolase family protein [Lachnospiraceae bacterium]|nr:amidohydrolase family protein [Lachnospiraceae bacterium]